MSKEFEPKENLTAQEITEMKNQLEKSTKAFQEQSRQNFGSFGQKLFSNVGKLEKDFGETKETAEKDEVAAFKEHFSNTSSGVLEETIAKTSSPDQQEAVRQILEERNKGVNADMEMIKELPGRENVRTIHESGNLDHDDADLLSNTKKINGIMEQTDRAGLQPARNNNKE